MYGKDVYEDETTSHVRTNKVSNRASVPGFVRVNELLMALTCWFHCCTICWGPGIMVV